MLAHGILSQMQYAAEAVGISYFLDDYPGAEAAYSVRLLSSTYAGNCIRVQRSSDSTQQDIGFDANGFLDTTALETFRNGSSTLYVTTWYDQSGNAENLVQNTVGDMPKIYYSGNYVTAGGKEAIHFIGAEGTYMTNNYSFQVSNDTSYFIVNTPTISPAAQDGGILQMQEDMGGGLYTVNSIGFRDGGYFCRLNPNGSGNTSLNGFDTTSTSQNLMSTIIDYSGVSNTFYYNNSTKTDVNAARSNTGTGDTLTVGSTADPSANLFTTLMLQELIFYPSNQSANVSDIHSNINDYYSLY